MLAEGAQRYTAIMHETQIKLDQFLKLVSAVTTGGEAKLLIQNGQVKVNGEIETRRGRKLHPGDRVEVAGQAFEVGALT